MADYVLCTTLEEIILLLCVSMVFFCHLSFCVMFWKKLLFQCFEDMISSFCMCHVILLFKFYVMFCNKLFCCYAFVMSLCAYVKLFVG